MKTIEIRRHSIRSPGEDHLNQKGVALARRVGRGLGPFDLVATSTLPRAFETAIAMGFAVHEQNELMNTYGGEVEREAPWPPAVLSLLRDRQTGRRRGAVRLPLAGLLHRHPRSDRRRRLGADRQSRRRGGTGRGRLPA
ncbi:MAG: histidine phosphatase family protein [Chloroflexi bacterium]|nr:histidine phosphatase family protein [Chloroflexota bacterium]